MSGVGPLKAFFDITVQVIRPAIFSIWTLIFINFFLDVSLTVILYTTQTMTLPVLLWAQMSNGAITKAFAIAAMESTIVFLILAVTQKYLGNVRSALTKAT